MKTEFPVPQRRGTGRVLLVLVALAVILIGQHTYAQLSYSSGRPVWPAYEGWMQNADGTADFLFGYMNENWEEELDVPVGPDNIIEPGGPDLGQPTHFLPRRNRFIFRVRAPKNFGPKDEMIWTLTTHGKSVKAYGSLKTDLLIENIDIMSETGALGAGTSSPEVRADKPPLVEVNGARTRNAKVGQPVTLVATVTDDGVPKTRGRGQAGAQTGRGAAGAANPQTIPGAPAGLNPAMVPPTRVTVGKTVGLHLSWFVYRGPGKVSFDPPQIKPWEDTRTGANSPWAPLWTPPTLPADNSWTTQVTFSEPGTYVLRGRADDGALFSDEDITINVAP